MSGLDAPECGAQVAVPSFENQRDLLVPVLIFDIIGIGFTEGTVRIRFVDVVAAGEDYPVLNPVPYGLQFAQLKHGRDIVRDPVHGTALSGFAGYIGGAEREYGYHDSNYDHDLYKAEPVCIPILLHRPYSLEELLPK